MPTIWDAAAAGAAHTVGTATATALHAPRAAGAAGTIGTAGGAATFRRSIVEYAGLSTYYPDLYDAAVRTPSYGWALGEWPLSDAAGSTSVSDVLGGASLTGYGGYTLGVSGPSTRTAASVVPGGGFDLSGISTAMSYTFQPAFGGAQASAVELWFQTTGTAARADLLHHLRMGAYGGNMTDATIMLGGTGASPGQVQFNIRVGVSDPLTSVISPGTTYNDGAWHQLVVVGDSSGGGFNHAWSLWMDGALVAGPVAPSGFSDDSSIPVISQLVPVNLWTTTGTPVTDGPNTFTGKIANFSTSYAFVTDIPNRYTLGMASLPPSDVVTHTGTAARGLVETAVASDTVARSVVFSRRNTENIPHAGDRLDSDLPAASLFIAPENLPIYGNLEDGKTGLFYGTLGDILTVPTWKQTANAGMQSVTLSVSKINQFAFKGQIVKIYEQGGDGSIIYTGLISDLPDDLSPTTTHSIVLQPLVTEIGTRSFVKPDGTPAAYINTDVAQIARDVAALGLHVTHSASTIPDTGITCTYTFSDVNGTDALNTLTYIAGPKYYWYIDERGVLFFTESDTVSSPTFALSQGGHYSTRLSSENIDNLFNYIKITGGIPPPVPGSTSQYSSQLTADGATDIWPFNDVVNDPAAVNTAINGGHGAAPAYGSPVFGSTIGPTVIDSIAKAVDIPGSGSGFNIPVGARVIAPRLGLSTDSNDLAWVKRMYLVLLDRPADPSGIGYDLGQLAAGASRQTVAAAIIGSGEFLARRVSIVYEQYLRHEPDGPGLAFWEGQLAGGTTDETLAIDVAASDEYFAAAGSTSGGFVTSLYLDALGRSPDPSGLAFWVDQIDNHSVTRASVATDLIVSHEGYNWQITLWYRRFLLRDPDPGGLAFFWSLFVAGQTNEQIIPIFIGGAEFYALSARLSLPAIPINAYGFSVEVWFKTSSTGECDIWQQSNTPGYTGYMALKIGGVSPAVAGGLGFWFTSADDLVTVKLNSSGTFNDNQWHYATFTRSVDGTVYSLYGDGALVDSHTVFMPVSQDTGAALVQWAPIQYATNGGDNNIANTFAGSLAYGAIYNGTCLSPAQITAHSNATITPGVGVTPTNIIAIYDSTATSPYSRRDLTPSLSYPTCVDQATLQNMANTLGNLLDRPTHQVELLLPDFPFKIRVGKQGGTTISYFEGDANPLSETYVGPGQVSPTFLVIDVERNGPVQKVIIGDLAFTSDDINYMLQRQLSQQTFNISSSSATALLGTPGAPVGVGGTSGLG